MVSTFLLIQIASVENKLDYTKKAQLYTTEISLTDENQVDVLFMKFSIFCLLKDWSSLCIYIERDLHDMESSHLWKMCANVAVNQYHCPSNSKYIF
jgi:hypothetical protein